MNVPLIDLRITDDLSGRAGMVDLDIDQSVRSAIDETVRTARLQLAEGCELSIMVCGDDTIRALNANWRAKDTPTNVLSFPNQREGPMLGDIVVSIDTMRREATLEKKSPKDHFSHLIVHGFLHLFGYDHMNEDEALDMERLETEILKNLGVADPHGNERN